MNKIIKQYENTDRDIKILTGIGYVSLFLSGLFLAWIIHEKKYDEVFNFIVPFGTLVAAILVAKVATRAILYQNYIHEMGAVALINDAIFSLMDFNDRINNIRKVFSGELIQPFHAVKQNTNKIVYLYEKFRSNSDIKKYLKTEDYEIIHRMNGTISGMETVIKAIPDALDNELFNLPPDETILKSLEEVENGSKQLEDNLRSLREKFST